MVFWATKRRPPELAHHLPVGLMVSASSFLSAPASATDTIVRLVGLYARPLEPILIPKLRIHIADFPYSRYSIRPEATHLGDLLRLLVRPGPDCRSPGFSRSAGCTPNTSKGEVLCPPSSPLAERINSRSRMPSGLRKTKHSTNSLAHRTTWLRSDFCGY